MKIAVIGTGYVGLPTGVGFAELGNEVVCIDKIPEKINDLNNGKITLYEQGLEELFLKNKENGRLKFTTNLADGVKGAEVIIIAVGTPTHPVTKEADMKYIHAAAGELSEHIKSYVVVAVKSTVPVGTGDDVEEIISQGKPNSDFDVVSLPEFLREGFAVEDFFNPDRIVIGADSEKAKQKLKELYAPFEGKTNFLFVSRKSSETIKYASNSFLAIKVHYINEMSNFCEKSGANIEEVAMGMGLDTRIGPKFLQPGPGYGGSCFPKDTLAMSCMARKYGVHLNLVETAIRHNELRKADMALRIVDAVGDIKHPRVAVLGLTFKGGTDDVRESPAMDIVEELLRYGLSLKVYDPKGMENAKPMLHDRVYYAKDVEDACAGTDLCVILTEWEEFKKLNFPVLKHNMRSPRIIDMRNLLNSAEINLAGLEYKCLGRLC